MNLAAALAAARWLVWDTFRQAQASGLFWLTLGATAVCVLFCLSVGVVGGEPLQQGAGPADAAVPVVRGELTLAFGAFRVKLGRDAADAVHFLELLLAGAVADTAGVLLALVWTAGFLPAFFEPSAAAVLLAKPLPRWGLLLGKYLGVLTFVGFHAVVFFTTTWLALALRTGVWDATYLLAAPILVLHFAIFFSMSALLAVWTRNTVATVFGSILFWFLCWGMNYGRHAVLGLPGMEALPAPFWFVVEAGYWILPKPADLGIILFDALGAGGAFTQPAEVQAMQAQGAFHPLLSVLTSLLFTGVMLALAGHELGTADY